MNNLSNIIKKIGKVLKYEIIGNVVVVETKDGKYCIKKQKRMDIEDIHSYIKSKKYNNIIDIRIIDGYEITPFIKDFKMPLEDRLTEGIYLISLLHNKTTFYKKVSIDEIKEIYENKTDNILHIKDYYESLCYNCDAIDIISPSDYLFVRNISILLVSLNKSKYYLDKWYSIVKDKKSKRCVLNHNNVDTSHILINDTSYLINFNSALFDSPITDLESIIRKNYKVLDIISTYNIYTSRYPLLKEEIYMLYSDLLIPDIIKKGKFEIENTKEIYEMYDYLDMINNFLLENDTINSK